MILDLDEFIAREKGYWDELRLHLDRQEEDPSSDLELEEIRRFHYLYQRASSDLVKLRTFAGEVETAAYLERLVARAYGRLHEERARDSRMSLWRWLRSGFPRTFRRHVRAFGLSVSFFLVGSCLGGFFLGANYDHKNDLLPAAFGHLSQSPSERVATEEEQDFDYFENRKSFSSHLMTHNIRVTYMTMVAGITWGVMTVILLFYNGVILGLVGYDYVMDGQAQFLAAWLLPHGSVEIPAILIGGQAGLVLARAMFGWGTSLDLVQRLRRIRADLISLAGGASLLLVWAALVESFLSQYHGPALYPWKIGFGTVQLLLLFAYLGWSGRARSENLQIGEEGGRRA